MATPLDLLADVHRALDSGDLTALARWGDIVGWAYEGDVPEATVIRRDERLVTQAHVLRLVGLSRASLHRLRTQGAFPRPVQVAGRRIAWRHSDVLSWLRSRPALAS
jgi:predicted DNA-binding transcriptional regulator AlpA